jgi:hypothetical protein
MPPSGPSENIVSNIPIKRRGDDLAVFIISFPYLAVRAASQLVAKVSGQAAREVKGTPTPAPSSESSAARPGVHQPATRTQRVVINSQTYNIYLYAQQQLIRVTSRANGHFREFHFTPTEAAAAGLNFGIPSAISWLQSSQGNPSTTPREVARASTVHVAPPKERAPTRMPVAKKPTDNPGTSAMDAAKRAPFTGSIAFMGEVKRNDPSKKQSYVTYVIRLRSSNGFEKEFAGEQLAELVDDHELQLDDFITLQFLGRVPFQVKLDDGTTEDRWRNTYALNKH